MSPWSHLQHHGLASSIPRSSCQCADPLASPGEDASPWHMPRDLLQLVGRLAALAIHGSSDQVEMKRGTRSERDLLFVIASWSPKIAATPALLTCATSSLDVNPGRLG